MNSFARASQDWSAALEAHLPKAFAQDVWKEFQSGRTTWSRPWSLYVLNEWVKHHGVIAAPREVIPTPRTAALRT